MLCGLRLGATLAVVAAEELGGVDTLVLVAPVISGKSYVRELGVQHQTWLSRQSRLELVQDVAEGSAVGAYGFRLYPDTLDQLVTVDLEQRAACPAQYVLLHDACDGVRISRLAERYRADGAQVEVGIFPEYNRFLLDPRFSVPPRQAFQRVLDWLGAAGRMDAFPAVDVVSTSAQARIDFADGCETVAVFGDGRHVGVFCQPRRALDGAPAVLFVNTGGVHRVGDGRLAVLMARRLAAQGVASLRMDLGGIGDGERRDNALTLDAIYERHAIDDAKAGVDWLASATHTQVVMFGVCTGAWVSMHTALTHAAVVGCMLVNLPFFTWGGAQTRPDAPHVASSRVYWQSLRDPRKWARLLAGRANGAAIAAELARRFYARLAARASAPVEWLAGLKTSTGAIRGLAAGLERKGVQTSLVYGSLDVGLDALAVHFGRNGRKLTRLTGITADIVQKIDHALFSQAAREAVMVQFERFLRERIIDAKRDAVSRTGSVQRRQRGLTSEARRNRTLSYRREREASMGTRRRIARKAPLF
jgi:pimeloyl-ACP methyl ester carboxylesterase